MIFKEWLARLLASDYYYFGLMPLPRCQLFVESYVKFREKSWVLAVYLAGVFAISILCSQNNISFYTFGWGLSD